MRTSYSILANNEKLPDKYRDRYLSGNFNLA